MYAHVKDSCIGCGLCTNLCPAVFAMTDAGKADVLQAVPAGMEDQVREAADACPVDAIHVS